MSSAELLLVFLVALLVFGPNKLPLLARDLGLLAKKSRQWQRQLLLYWQQIQLQQQLADNSEKAAKADDLYQQRLDKPEDSGEDHAKG